MGYALALLSHAIEHTLLQQIDVGSAKHLALEHFEAVNLPLYWPRAPRQGDARFHGSIICSQALCEALKRLEPAGCGPLEPGLKLGGWALTHEGGKVLRQRDRVSDCTLLVAELSELLLFVIGERGLTPQDQPGRSTRG